jgi:hypothetical protein
MYSTANLRQFCYPRSSGHCIDYMTGRNNGLRWARKEASRGKGVEDGNLVTDAMEFLYAKHRSTNTVAGMSELCQKVFQYD